MLSVGDGHWLYVEEVGRPDGIPVIFLHGGPGSGCQHAHRSLFDPERFHAILFDQRGAGRSHPYLSRDANTTQHLVADIERIREHFQIDKWLVVGGSWGSTLALAYAEAHPERVAAVVLRAIFLGTRDEVEWAFVGGPQRFRPELYDAFLNFLPPSERRSPIASYCARLLSPDPSVQAPAAHVWNAYERALSELAPGNAKLPVAFDAGARLPPTPVMEAHYIANDFFLPPGALLDRAHRLNGIPGHIVQGRYDMICPPRTAHRLQRAWPGATLRMVTQAGHALSEPGISSELVAVMDTLRG
jgi:proline iminopeptidase